MERRARLVALLLAAGSVGAPGCGGSSTPAGGDTPPAPAAPAPAPTPAAAEAPPQRPPPEPLTQEELDLIAADPATLTPALRRQRAFALRKKIMQNPDSPAAQSLEKIRRQIESGEVKPQLPDRGVTFHARMPADKTAEGAPVADGPTPSGGGAAPSGGQVPAEAPSPPSDAAAPTAADAASPGGAR